MQPEQKNVILRSALSFILFIPISIEIDMRHNGVSAPCSSVLDEMDVTAHGMFHVLVGGWPQFRCILFVIEIDIIFGQRLEFFSHLQHGCMCMGIIIGRPFPQKTEIKTFFSS